MPKNTVYTDEDRIYYCLNEAKSLIYEATKLIKPSFINNNLSIILTNICDTITHVHNMIDDEE